LAGTLEPLDFECGRIVYDEPQLGRSEGQRVRLLRGPAADVLDLAFSPDGTAIAAGFNHFPVYLWNLEAATPAPVRLPAEGRYLQGGLFFSPNGRSLWWRRKNGYRVYDRDLREHHALSFANGGVAHGAFASTDGAWVVSRHGMPDHCLIGWELADDEWVRRWVVSIADIVVESITLSPDHRLLALITRSALERPQENPRQVEVWDTASREFRGKGDYPYAYAPTLFFAPGADALVAINDMTLMVWRVPQLGDARLVRNDNRKDFTSAAFHPSGRRLYAASNDGTIQVFDTSTWSRLERFTWQIGKPKAVAVSADGTLAAAGGENGDIVIWDVDE
jgi:WD40 repeat protein